MLANMEIKEFKLIQGKMDRNIKCRNSHNHLFINMSLNKTLVNLNVIFNPAMEQPTYMHVRICGRGGGVSGVQTPYKIQISLNSHYEITKNMSQTRPLTANSNNRWTPPPLWKKLTCILSLKMLEHLLINTYYTYSRTTS